MSSCEAEKPEEIARALGGEGLVRFFDAIQAEQRKRWNVPDWRTQRVIEADKTNWNDIAIALRAHADSAAIE